MVFNILNVQIPSNWQVTKLTFYFNMLRNNCYFITFYHVTYWSSRMRSNVNLFYLQGCGVTDDFNSVPSFWYLENIKHILEVSLVAAYQLGKKMLEFLVLKIMDLGFQFTINKLFCSSDSLQGLISERRKLGHSARRISNYKLLPCKNQ